MSNKSKVTVILTSYNHARYLREAINSVLAQTFSDFELIIWDDASTDDSWDIVNSYTDSRIRAFRNENNLRSGNINRALDQATGEYVAIHHSDDAWEPEKLEKQVAFIDSHPEIGAVFTWAQIVDEDGQPFQDDTHFYYKIFEQPNRSRYEWLNYFFYHSNALCHPSLMIRKQCYAEIGLYRNGLAQVPDLDMWVRLCMKYEIYVLPEKLVRFRIRKGEANTSGGRPESIIRHHFETFQVYKNFLSIKDKAEMEKIFPTAAKYFANHEFDIQYALAQLSLSANFNFAKLLGMQLLQELIQKESGVEVLEKFYNFRMSDFLQLTGRQDIFAVVAIPKLQAQLAERNARLAEQNAQLANIQSSKAWRLVLILRRIRIWLAPLGSRREKIVHMLYRALKAWHNEGISSVLRKIRTHFIEVRNYQIWILKNEPTKLELATQTKNSKDLSSGPLISIITPVYNTPKNILNATIQSVIKQTYNNWELCIANGSPGTKEIRKILDKYAKKDSRIKVVHLEKNLGIAGNTNAAIDVSTGDFVGFLDHDDLLAPFALFSVAQIVMENPNVDMFYSDEDKITADGRRRYDPFFKPAFSPEFIRGINYMPHFLVISRKVGDEIGWIREGFDGAQDYDLVLRMAEKAKEIAHLPAILYHWRALSGSTALTLSAKDYATESGIKALQNHLDRMNIKGRAERGHAPTTYRVPYHLTNPSLVSIIIPNRDHANDLKLCINSILEKSSYRNFEILIVENNSCEEGTFSLYKELTQHSNVKVIEYTEQTFNYSKINNFAVSYASGDVLVFLNNDVEIITPDWLEHMLKYVARPDVGIVGAKLYYPIDTIQHGGIILGIGGIAGHAHKNAPRTSSGYFNRLALPQNISAVTAACLMIKKELFNEILGFDPTYQLAFGDVDLCMKVREKGYLLVWTPYSELYHHESKTRGYEDNEEKRRRFQGEIENFRQKWSIYLERGDDYYSPNLTLDNEDFSINPNPRNQSARITPGFTTNQDKSQPSN